MSWFNNLFKTMFVASPKYAVLKNSDELVKGLEQAGEQTLQFGSHKYGPVSMLVQPFISRYRTGEFTNVLNVYRSAAGDLYLADEAGNITARLLRGANNKMAFAPLESPLKVDDKYTKLSMTVRAPEEYYNILQNIGKATVGNVGSWMSVGPWAIDKLYQYNKQGNNWFPNWDRMPQ